MKFPLIITVDTKPMSDLIEKSVRSSNELFGFDVFGNPVIFEHGSCSNNKESSLSALSCVTSKLESNCTNFEFVDAERVDDLKENYLFSDKTELKKALHIIALRNNFEFKTTKSHGTTLIV